MSSEMSPASTAQAYLRSLVSYASTADLTVPPLSVLDDLRRRAAEQSRLQPRRLGEFSIVKATRTNGTACIDVRARTDDDDPIVFDGLMQLRHVDHRWRVVDLTQDGIRVPARTLLDPTDPLRQDDLEVRLRAISIPADIWFYFEVLNHSTSEVVVEQTACDPLPAWFPLRRRRDLPAVPEWRIGPRSSAVLAFTLPTTSTEQLARVRIELGIRSTTGLRRFRFFVAVASAFRHNARSYEPSDLDARRRNL